MDDTTQAPRAMEYSTQTPWMLNGTEILPLSDAGARVFDTFTQWGYQPSTTAEQGDTLLAFSGNHLMFALLVENPDNQSVKYYCKPHFFRGADEHAGTIERKKFLKSQEEEEDDSQGGQ